MKLKRKHWLALSVGVLLVSGGISLWRVQERHEDRDRFHKVTAGRLYRSRQPGADCVEQFDKRGIVTVFNLRPRNEDPKEYDREAQFCRQRGIEMVNLPMTLHLASDEQLLKFFRTMHHRPGPALVHCQHGRNRTGIIIAAYRVVFENWDPQRAAAELTSYDHTPTPSQEADRLALLQRLAAERQKWLDLAEQKAAVIGFSEATQP